MQTMLGAWDKNVGAGNNMSSKLAQRVATNGLANSYMAFNTNYHDTGLFGVYAVCDKDAPVSHLLINLVLQVLYDNGAPQNPRILRQGLHICTKLVARLPSTVCHNLYPPSIGWTARQNLRSVQQTAVSTWHCSTHGALMYTCHPPKFHAGDGASLDLSSAALQQGLLLSSQAAST